MTELNQRLCEETVAQVRSLAPAATIVAMIVAAIKIARARPALMCFHFPFIIACISCAVKGFIPLF
jgi:hypothetical protein